NRSRPLALCPPVCATGCEPIEGFTIDFGSLEPGRIAALRYLEALGDDSRSRLLNVLKELAERRDAELITAPGWRGVGEVRRAVPVTRIPCTILIAAVFALLGRHRRDGRNITP